MDTTTDLKPFLWNAPGKPWHDKHVYANHHFHTELRWDDLEALPKDQQRRPIWKCQRCGGLVVWAVSKTGNRFLCDVVYRKWRTKTAGSRQTWSFYPSRWHSKTCGGNHG